MINVHEAERLIGEHSLELAQERVHLDCAHGRVLAQAIRADRDGPPFHRVAMDGISIANDSLHQTCWPCEGRQAAGEEQKHLKDVAHCLEAMTGAPLPVGCETVVPFEHIDLRDGSYHLTGPTPKPDFNVHFCGEDFKLGDELLEPGKPLRSPEIAVAASVGCTDLLVEGRPRIALITTGSELVDVASTPLPHQIRKSNVHAAAAALRARGLDQLSLDHLSDDLDATINGLQSHLESNDVLILSGGVSKGKLDHVPAALEACGVKKVFHRITQKPGKPMWFGHRDSKLVFACPGNPVSMLVCLERYVLPHLTGHAPTVSVQCKEEIRAKANMTLFANVSRHHHHVERVKGHGSGDFVQLCRGDGFIEIPPSDAPWPPGTTFTFRPWH